MEHVGGVHRLQGAEGLVDKVLAVIIAKVLCADHTVHVGFHQLLDKVDFREAVVVSRLLDVEDGDDVFVVKVAEELHLAEGAEAEHGVVEGSDLLDGHFLARGLVESGAVEGESALW